MSGDSSGSVLPEVGHPLGDHTKPEWDGSGGASTRLSTSDAKVGEAAATAESPPAPLPAPSVPEVGHSYTRSKDGGVVHKSTCRSSNPERPWLWAEGLDVHAMGERMQAEGLGFWGATWLHLCRVCFTDDDVFEGMRP